MKKLFLICLCLMLAISLIGCNAQNSIAQTSEIESQSSTQSTQEEKPANKLTFKTIDKNVKHVGVCDGIFQIVLEDDKIALMNMDGKLINDEKYTFYVAFSEGYAFVVDEEDNRYYINTNGEKAIEKVDGKDIYVGDIFKDGVAAVLFGPYGIDASKGEKPPFTYINTSGEVIDYEVPMYEGKQIFYANEFGAFYTDGECFGIFDTESNTPISGLDYIEGSAPFYEDRAIAIDKNNDVLLIDSSNNIIKNLSEAYKEGAITSYSISPDAITLNFDNHAIICDLDGNETLRTNFTYINEFVDGYATCELNGKIGLIDTLGNEIIPCEYDEMSFPYKGHVLLRQNDTWSICTFVR